ncbi:hypothetical protein TWF225_000152 [Orbilia oligospora]|nr:hypothetical protein TWF225_000152 [Orbilia oligospora]KAF3235137.1 hypothetical protein TWF128_002129 [Orbilia oligospora]KAF3259923.1 hypothetical protein TWF217_004957 [Orbilia oligospora]KAF3297514.1 hypothetical protein TWF132_005943 [Orbilia oligospora]
MLVYFPTGPNWACRAKEERMRHSEEECYGVIGASDGSGEDFRMVEKQNTEMHIIIMIHDSWQLSGILRSNRCIIMIYPICDSADRTNFQVLKDPCPPIMKRPL